MIILPESAKKECDYCECNLEPLNRQESPNVWVPYKGQYYCSLDDPKCQGMVLISGNNHIARIKLKKVVFNLPENAKPIKLP